MTEAPKSADAAAQAWPRWRVFPPVALGVIMATLDASVVNIALPTLQRGFGSPLSTVEWVGLAYALTLTGLLLTSGRLADAHGRRRVYSLGLLLFTAASVLCGAAPSVGWLIALRALQGVGAALVSGNGSALLVQAFPAEERGRALGAFGAMVGIGLAIGPPLGGMVVESASWRWIFFVNLPLGLLAWWMARVRIPADAPSSVAPRVEPLPPLLWGIGLALLVLAVTRGPESGWASAGVLSLALTGLALLAAFLTLQRRSADPLLPLELVAGPLGAAVTLTFLGQLLSVSVGFLMPFVLETSGGLHAAQTGRWLTVLPGAALLCAPIAGRLADRLSPRTLTVAGMALTAAGLWMLAGLGQAISYPWLATALSLVGVGLGLFTIPNSSALLSLVPRERLGVASGLQGTARTLGLTGGVALGGAMITAYYHHHTGGALHLGLGQVDGAAFALATRETFRGMAVLAVLGIWLSWRVRSPRRATP